MKRTTAVVVITAVLLTSACDLGNDSEKHANVSWASATGRDLNCPGKLEAAPFSPQAYDINGDKVLDWFVAMRCATQPAPQPFQVEVFNGQEPPRSSAPIATLTRSIGDAPDQRIYLDKGCLYFSSTTVYVVGLVHATRDDPTLTAGVHIWTFGPDRAPKRDGILRIPSGTSSPFNCPQPIRAGKP